MSLYVLTFESVSGSEVLGAYNREKEAKDAASEYVEKHEGVLSKVKVLKKNTDQKKLLYTNKVDVNLYMSTVEFKGTEKKAKKNPDEPKRGMSAFMIFSKESRNSIKTDNPEATFGEIGSLVGQAWKALNEEQKLVFTEKAAQDKQRYESDLQTYTDRQV